jgi:hypothetical protein
VVVGNKIGECQQAGDVKLMAILKLLGIIRWVRKSLLL